MDLKDLDTVAGSSKGFELQLFHPGTQADLGMFITVLGRDSEEFKKVSAEHNRRRVAKAQKSGAARLTLSLEEVEAESVDLLVACTKSWRQQDKDTPEGKATLTLQGEELECTRANAEKLYKKYPWIREQVDQAVVDRANFLGR